MRKLFLSLAFIACLSLTATVGAQNTKRGGQRGLSKELNLTAEQQQQMKSVNDDFKAKMKELRAQHQDAVKNVLTPEQQTKWKELRGKEGSDMKRTSERRAKQKDMKGKKAENRKFASNDKKRMGGKLDEASAAKLKTLKENFEKEKKAVELSRIAPDAQKKKISELRDNFKKEKRRIITDARKAKVDEAKSVS